MPSRQRRAAAGAPRVTNGTNSAVSFALPWRMSEARRRLDLWTGALHRQTKQHPGRVLAIALGAGYLLGGGLFSSLTARALSVGLRIGLRIAPVPLVAAALGESLLGQRQLSSPGRQA